MEQNTGALAYHHSKAPFAAHELKNSRSLLSRQPAVESNCY